MMKNKIFMIITVLILLFASVGCAGEQAEVSATLEPTAEPTEEPDKNDWIVTCNDSGTSEYTEYTIEDFEDLELHTVNVDGVEYEGYNLLEVFDIINPNKDPESIIAGAAVEKSDGEVFMFSVIDILNEIEAYMIINKYGEPIGQPILYANEKIYGGVIQNVAMIS